MAEKHNGGDFFAFTRRLVEANQGDKRLNRAEWLAELDRVSGGSDLSQQIAVMLDEGAKDPPAAIGALLRQAKIPFALDAKGVPQLP